MVKKTKSIIQKLDGANMDIDLITPQKNISWKQEQCPWNKAESIHTHQCAIKNISICPYFCGIEYLDFVLCCYPHKNPNKTIENYKT
ncbi:MAG: hypothetical protein ABIH82_02100 [Candidatus Woesearchaeota archaeon]